MQVQPREYRDSGAVPFREGRPVIEGQDKNLLLFFMSSHAIKKLDMEMLTLYNLLWKYWGRIDRKCVYRLLNLPYMEKEVIHGKLSKALGDRIVDIAISTKHYLATWRDLPVKKESRDCHIKLQQLQPKMYEVAAKLLSGGCYTHNKDFKEAVCVSVKLSSAVLPLYAEQALLASTVKNETRSGWLNELHTQTILLSSACHGIVGMDETTSLLSR